MSAAGQIYRLGQCDVLYPAIYRQQRREPFSPVAHTRYLLVPYLPTRLWAKC
jgi:hypothetical protein